MAAASAQTTARTAIGGRSDRLNDGVARCGGPKLVAETGPVATPRDGPEPDSIGLEHTPRRDAGRFDSVSVPPFPSTTWPGRVLFRCRLFRGLRQENTSHLTRIMGRGPPYPRSLRVRIREVSGDGVAAASAT